jgi:hypothetical protein
LIVLADSDIVIKLGCCDLFAEFLTAFQITPGEIQVQKATRFSVRHRKGIPEAARAKITEFLGSVADLGIAPDSRLVAILTEEISANIDAGEAALFGACRMLPDSLVATGDKKSLAGFALVSERVPEAKAAFDDLAGRVICFEQIILTIVDCFGLERVRSKLVAGRECDSGLSFWLGRYSPATEPDFRAGLISYLDELRVAAKGLVR